RFLAHQDEYQRCDERGSRSQQVAVADTAACDDERAHEGADELPDSVDTSQGRQHTGASQRWRDLGEIGVPGKIEDGGGRSDGEDCSAQREDSGDETGEQEAEGRNNTGNNHCDPVAEAGGQGAGREVSEDLAYGEQSR